MTTRQAWCAKCDGVAVCDERGCIGCDAASEERARETRTNNPVLAAFCAACITGKIGLHRGRLDPGGPWFTLCASCDFTGGLKPPKGRHRYKSLDETLDSMRVRILRAIRHFDWATPAMLTAALRLPGWDEDRDAMQLFCGHLLRLVRAGHLVRIGDVMHHEYQITESGRSLVERELARCAA